MSQACEDFLRGHGRLAGLLWELKPYEPPASLEASFLAAARAAQMSAGAASGSRAYEHQPAFEAPADMTARFSQLAAQVDAAQAARREAVLGQIAAGDAPQAVLGAPIQPETAAWLKQKAAGMKPVKPPRKPVLWGFSWFDLRLAALATILAAVGTQWLLQFAPSPVETALLEAFSSEAQPLADAQPVPPQNPAKPAPNSPPAHSGAKMTARSPEHERPALDATRRSPDRQTASPEHSDAPVPEETPVLAAAAPPSPEPAELKRERSPQDSLAEATLSPPAARKAMPSRVEEPVTLSAARAAPAAAKAAAAPAADPVPMTSAPARLAAPVYAMPAPSAPARPAALAASAPPAAEIQSRQAATTRSFDARISEDPVSFASLLPARPAGLVWRVVSRVEDDATARNWLETLRQSMPAESRPARFELIHEAGSNESGWLRIFPPPAEARTR